MTMIYTGKTISFQHNGKFHTANSSHPEFTKIVELCKVKKFADAAGLLDIKTVISQALSGTAASIVGNQVVYKGQPVNGVLAQRILELRREGFTVEPLLRFLDNLMQNPSLRATEELYGFLEASKLPITDDGYFLAYKSVRQDFTDHHTGKMDNSVGTVVRMPRNQVDEDKDRTCSRGLHFAAHEYAKDFGSGGRMVVLKINPRDVVAIPSDYNNQKGRACEYLILEEVQRSDTKLVGRPVVQSAPSARVIGAPTYVAPAAPVAPPYTPKFPVGTKVRIAKSSQYYNDLRFPKSNPIGVNGVVVSVPTTEYNRLAYRVDWETGFSNCYNEADLELAPTYTPESDNYKNSRRWDAESLGIITFIGKAEQFPVNRDVPYILERKSNKKVYSGEFYFTSYNTKTGSLVFQRLDHEGEVDRYVTITDPSDWFIQVDTERN